jgi:hypothetical protein
LPNVAESTTIGYLSISSITMPFLPQERPYTKKCFFTDESYFIR